VINLELFSCAGGMAKGFLEAGIEFDMAVDFAEDHCDSYEKNIGHRPIRMDVRDLLRMVQLGWRIEIDLIVADPPCTPWSRAGKRLGSDDERDMLEDTCELISLLRPRRFLIGNVPGLDDAVNLSIVQRVIGGLARFGYCTADFARLDAADYGVPQNRVRPFWFGHLTGPCIRWPRPTHGDRAQLATAPLFDSERLAPWVTCAAALGHLPEEQLGRQIRLPRRKGFTPSALDAPAMTVTAGDGGGGHRVLVLANRHESPVHTSTWDAPARAITTQCRSAGHATTIEVPVGDLRWPWNRPATTVQADPRLAPPGHHDEDFAVMSLPGAIELSELAATILQGFPESWVFSGATKKARWSQIGQAMPPPLAAAVARSVAEQMRGEKKGPS
jgi:site-specific DNA-cytosine methylase